MSHFKFHVFTVSDTCSLTPDKDTAGPALADALKSTFPDCEITASIIPDEEALIQSQLLIQTDEKQVNGVFTTGGTGFSPRDVTPEATKKVITRDAPAITTAMTVGSLKITPMAMLSRAIAGIRGQTLIVNFPGSKKAVTEIFPMIQPCLDHALSLLIESTEKVTSAHIKMQSEGKPIQKQHICPHKSSLDASKIALRERASSYPMLEVSVCLDMIFEHINSLARQTITLPIEDSLGFVLAEDIYAKEPLPPFEASIKDGYAVIAADGDGIRKVQGGVIAGSLKDDTLQRGFCVRINTGAPLPPNADAVVMVEDTKLLKSSDDGKEELEIEIMAVPKVGLDVRPIGSDIALGERVISAGSVLDGGNIGILATVGVTKVSVFRKPVVGILSTGNELQSPSDAVLKPAHIRDSNKIMLISILKDFGFSSKDFGICRDEPEATLSSIRNALEVVDILITTGSVSMGDRDLIKPILKNDLNAVIHFGRVNMKPGKPTTFATCEYNNRKKFIFALPGNPVSAFVTSHLFLIPALKQLTGEKRSWCEIQAELSDSHNLDPRPEYARAILTFSKDKPYPVAKLLGNQVQSAKSNSDPLAAKILCDFSIDKVEFKNIKKHLPHHQPRSVNETNI